MLLFASLYEGFGLPILEAQSVGRVVITSIRGAMAEVAGKGAVLVDPFSIKDIRYGIQSLIQDEALRKLLISEGILNKNRYKSETIINHYESIFSSF
jgi:glycosyltransferase involved in cell wall biosynthesis